MPKKIKGIEYLYLCIARLYNGADIHKYKYYKLTD